MDFLKVIGIAIAAVPAFLYLLGLCVPAAFTVWEQLSCWFSYGLYDNINPRYNGIGGMIKQLLVWILGVPGTIVGIALWIVAHIPKMLISLVEKLLR